MSTVVNGNYNEGALAGRFALRDLTNSGKFTNILNVVPHRVKTEVSGSNLIVSKGSTFTVLFGLSEADLNPYNIYKKATQDYTLNVGVPITDVATVPAEDPEAYQYVVYNHEADRLELGAVGQFVYHKEAILDEGIEANTFLNPYGQKCSLPIGYIDENNVWHQFNCIGFHERLAWVDVGLEGLCPDGRDEKGGLKVFKTEITQVVFTEFENSELNNFDNGLLMMDVNGNLIVSSSLISSSLKLSIDEGYNYVAEDNIIIDHLGYNFRGCRVCNQSMKNGMLYDLNTINTYAPANFTEMFDRIVAVDNSALHCTGKEDIVEHAYGDKYFHDNVKFDDITVTGGSFEGVSITKPFTIQTPQITESVSNLHNLTSSLPYTGEFGGLEIKHDAYITSIGNPVNNPNLKNHLQIVGASEAGKAGIVFGNKQTVSIMGDSAESNMYVTVGSEGAILPTLNNKFSIGNANNKFKEMHATNFIGTASQTYWADLAEKYLTDEAYPVGTIVKWGGAAEITVAEGEKDLAGVISENPAYLMNADSEGQPLALAGRVKVRVVGKVKKHERITLSDIAGVGIGINYFDEGTLKGPIVGRALEDKESDEEGLVLCVVKFDI